MPRERYHGRELRSILARVERGQLIQLGPEGLPWGSCSPWWPWRAWYPRPGRSGGPAGAPGARDVCAWASLTEPCGAVPRRRRRWVRRRVGLTVTTQGALPWGTVEHTFRAITRRALVVSCAEVSPWLR